MLGQVKGKLQGRVITSLNSGLESFLHLLQLLHLRLDNKEQSGTGNLRNRPLVDFCFAHSSEADTNAIVFWLLTGQRFFFYQNKVTLRKCFHVLITFQRAFVSGAIKSSREIDLICQILNYFWKFYIRLLLSQKHRGVKRFNFPDKLRKLFST